MGKKKIAAIFTVALLAMTMALAGCSGGSASKPADEGAKTSSSVTAAAGHDAADVAGNYICESVFLDGEEVSGYADSLQLDADGKGTCVYEDEDFDLRWQLDGDAIAWSDVSGDTFAGTVDFENGTITGVYSIDYQEGDHGDLEYTFKKVK